VPHVQVVEGGFLLVMLLISVVFGLIPLAGIAWIILEHAITSVDGLFMSLILLTLSGVFFLNAFLELRDRGLFGKSKAVSAKAGAAPKDD
jgi:hypothetical protein